MKNFSIETTRSSPLIANVCFSSGYLHRVPINVEQMHFPYDQLSNKLEGMNLDANNQQQPPVTGYQSQINNSLTSASPGVYASSNLTNGSTVASDAGVIQNANQSINQELNRSGLEHLQAEPLKQDKPSEESKSNLPSYQQFIPNYSSPISSLPQQQPPAQTLFNPNLSHQNQVSSPNQNLPNTSTIPTYQPMPSLHYQQLPTSNQSQFPNYPPINQPTSAGPINYPPHGPLQSQFNPHTMYLPPVNSQQFVQHTSPAPVSSQNVQLQQSFIHNPAIQQSASVHTPPPVAQPPRDVSNSPVQPGLPQSNLAGSPSSLPSQPGHLPAQSSVSPPTSQQQQQPNYSFTTPLNLPGMPPLNVRLDSSKIPLSNLEFDTIIGNTKT